LLADVYCGTLRAMRAAAVVVLCAGLAVQAEEIRIEVGRGQRAARIEAGGRNHALAVVDSVLTVDGKAVASAEFPGPVRVDGRELPGRLEVFIDRGVEDGVEEGNTFAVLRQGDGLNNAFVTKSYTGGKQGARAAKVAVPEESVGLLLVVDARDHLSTAVVIKSIRELQAGDLVEMRGSGSGGGVQ